MIKKLIDNIEAVFNQYFDNNGWRVVVTVRTVYEGIGIGVSREEGKPVEYSVRVDVRITKRTGKIEPGDMDRIIDVVERDITFGGSAKEVSIDKTNNSEYVDVVVVGLYCVVVYPRGDNQE